MDFIDTKYIGLLASRLHKFKKVKINLYTFRCPICGDSKKNKNRTRGYLYQVKTNTNFKCHNCGASMSFNNFLKELDPTLHKEYTMEKFKSGFTGKNFVVPAPKLEFKKPVFHKSDTDDLPKIDLPKASEIPAAKKYLEDRKLDPNVFFYAKNYKEWTNSKKLTFKNFKCDESRIIIPLYNRDKALIGFQARSLKPNSVKYITTMLDEEAPKIYGLDKINPELPIYVVEGPFDSTFISNCLALCGSDGDMSRIEGNDFIFVYDNEPHNKEIVQRISDAIDRGYKVVIWPSTIKSKDINDMVLEDYDVQNIVDSNIYQGLKAKVKLNNWKKI